MEIGDKIKEIRKQKGVTVDELAMRLGVTRQTIYEFEKGTPTFRTIKKLANALNVDISEFFTPQKTPQNASNSDFKLQVLLDVGEWLKTANEDELKLLQTFIDKIKK